MAQFLRKIGLTSFENPWKVIAVWGAILAILGVGAWQFMKPASSDISIPGTQAQTAIDRAAELFPDGGKGSGRIVFEAAPSKQIVDYETEITALVNKLKATDEVAQVISPIDTPQLVAQSKTIAYAQVQLEKTPGETSKPTFEAIKAAAEQARVNGLQVEISKALTPQAPEDILGIGEVAGVVIALVVLVMTLGSLIAAGLPLLTALIGVGVSMAGLFAMSQLFTIGATTPVLAVMLGLAVGIDYSLFIINKYRGYALEGYSFKEAAARATSTAGNAVVFAALTVVIALAALAIVNIPFMTTMGLVGAGSIAIAAVIAITIIPAFLALAGKHLFSKKARLAVANTQKHGLEKTEKLNKTSFWYRWGKAITVRPWPVLLIALLVIGIIALPAKDMKLGLPTDQYAAANSTERRAYDILSKGFGVGFNGPLTLVVEGLPAVSSTEENIVRQAAMAEFTKKAEAAAAEQKAAFEKEAMEATTPEQQLVLQQKIAAAEAAGESQKQQALAQIETNVAQYAKLVHLKKAADKIAQKENVAEALPATATDNGSAGIIQVVPKTAPTDEKTVALIADLRSESTQKEVAGNATIAVTGTTALEEDVSAKLAAALPQYLAVVVGLSLVLLVVAFRSIVIPIKATLGFLLSVFAMFGALVAVFQWGWFGIADAPGPIVSFIPIIAIGILFGLAMDYEFFLVSGMHEAYATSKDAREAVVHGFGAGSKVVTAAGIIMVSVFAGFITNHDTTIQAMGFGLAIGILIDAFIVRMTIVPAVMTLLGKASWWLPSWLDKRLPHVSIEEEEK